MIVDGVTFVEARIRDMTKTEFLKLCMGLYYQDLSKDDRRNKLSDIYDRICQKPEETDVD